MWWHDITYCGNEIALYTGNWRWILKSNLNFNERDNSNSTSETVLNVIWHFLSVLIPKYIAGPLVQNAIRRYEKCWLPLVAENGGQDMVPPLDVHWIWHVHMLAPCYYREDCLNIIDTVPDHKLLSCSCKTYKTVMKHTRTKWAEKYKDEPFNVPLDISEINIGRRFTMFIYSTCRVCSPVYGQRNFWSCLSFIHAFFSDINLGNRSSENSH